MDNTKIVSVEALDTAEAEAKKPRLLQTSIDIVKHPVPTTGRVFVAKYYPGKALPKAPPGARPVLIHTSAAGLGGALSPYVLKDEHGCLLENIWQFSKVYQAVTKQRVPLGRFHPNTIIWEHPAEVHFDPRTNELLKAYWDWRLKGTHNTHAIRYPNGFHGRSKCLFSVWGPTQERLGYIDARKRIYCAEYARLAPQTEAFHQLAKLLRDGQDLQLVEVDGPDPALDFAPYDQISRDNPSMIMNEDNIRLLVNDARKPFGHGFVIAALLLGGQSWMQ